MRRCLCSYAGRLDAASEYVDRLCRDIKEYSEKCKDYKVDTLYFGGGTPTLLPIKEFERISNALRAGFDISEHVEISCECNPATADLNYFKDLRSLGINRLSIGLQSAHNSELRALGRIHTLEDFCETYDSARTAGFDNISADIMYGIPTQTFDTFAKTLSKLVSLAPEHISSYGLKIEDGTPFGKMRDSLVLPDEDTEYDMYMHLSNYLAENGYAKYEISNFARKGRESRHNLKYWHSEEYIGFGVAAHSYFGGERFANSRDFSSYIKNSDIVESRSTITEDESMTEFVMLSLRLTSGVSHKEFRERFLKDFLGIYGDKLKKYIDGGFVLSDENNTFFTDKGFFVSNYILSDILDFD